jgi:hypothetical protein
MNLDELFASLEKAASEAPAASKDQEKPLVSQELDALLTKEAAATSLTQAYEEGERLALEVLEKMATEAITQAPAATQEPKQENTENTEVEATTEKQASAETQPTTTEETMNKEAEDKALAALILEKIAQDVTAANNAGGPNKLQQDQAALVAAHDARITPMPGRNGTINQLFDAIVAKAQAMGYTDYNQVAGGTTSTGSEGSAPGSQSIPPSPDVQEKQAAVSALIDAGLDWDVAVDMVKAAAEEIAAEEYQQTKVAAVQHLMKVAGLDFDKAVEAVAAAETELVNEAESTTEGEEVYDEQTKAAALNELIEQGVDFETAVNLIKEASLGK